MASMAPSTGSTIPRRESDSLIRKVKGPILNRQLTAICQLNGLKSTGVKADMQNRIVAQIQEAINSGDIARFHHLRSSIEQTVANRNVPSQPPPSAQSYAHPTSSNALLNYSNQYHQTMAKSSPGLQAPRDYPAAGTNGHRFGGPSHHTPSSQLSFTPSPFYRIESTLCTPRTCEAMSQHRNSVSVPLRLNENLELQKCVDDRNYRVMVFCAGDSVGTQDITFPHQSEIKVNGTDMRANLRGLKGKPGSTRPVDITSSLRLKSSYPNTIDFTYALTTKKFYLLVALCKITPVSELVQTIRTRSRLPKNAVIADLNRKAQDPDVVATSQVLSLKCPLSYMRLAVPCRGTACKHLQCFDATSYLQLQEQGPQWLCPICNRPTPFEQLAVDEYVKDILQNTSSSLETVTIEPNGRWKLSNGDSRSRHSNGVSSVQAADDDDDDDLEISEVNVIGGRRLETPKTAATSMGTPASAAGSSSSTVGHRGMGSTSNKRPAPAVIDLTLSSDDDDDEPIQRPAKRQNTSSNGFQLPSSTYSFSSPPF